MLFKDFKKRYKNYELEVQGKPLYELVIPYSYLPKNKDLNKCEVIDYEIIPRQSTIRVFDCNMKYKGKYRTKGIIRVYVK